MFFLYVYYRVDTLDKLWYSSWCKVFRQKEVIITVMAENARSLRAIRMELGVSRERLARRAQNLSTGTIRNVEYGRCRITIGKAHDLLSAINCLLAEAQQPLITLDDLNIKLY